MEFNKLNEPVSEKDFKKVRKMQTKVCEAAVDVLLSAGSAVEVQDRLTKICSNKEMSPELQKIMKMHTEAEIKGTDELLKKMCLEDLGFAAEDKDPYSNGDQTMLYGMEAFKLQSQWASGFDYNPMNNKKLSQWCKACYFGDTQKVREFLDSCSTSEDKTKLLERRESMLRFCGISHVIAGARMDPQNEHIDIAKLLIESGCRLDVKDVAGYTPLHHCLTKYGNSTTLKIAQILVDNGAKINAVNRFGCTPLFEPCMNLMYDFVEFLVCNGADPQIKENNGITCHSFASRNPKLRSIFSKGYRSQAKNDRKKAETSNSALHCGQCGSEGKLKKCSACLSVGYCSRACQTNNWKEHKSVCKTLQESKKSNVVTVEPVSNPLNKGGATEMLFNEKSKKYSISNSKSRKYTGTEKAMKVKIQVALGADGAKKGPMLAYNKDRSFNCYISDSDANYQPVFDAVVAKGYGGIKAYFACVLKNSGKLEINLSTTYPETF